MSIFSMLIPSRNNFPLLPCIMLPVLFLCPALKSSAQNDFQHVWSNVIKNTSVQGGNTIGHGTKNDAAGNTYVVGTFNNTADMDPGPGQYNLFSLGQTDVFVAKYAPSGSLVWAKSMGSPNFDQGYDLALDAAGNVYITGNFNGTMSVDLPFGKTTLTSVGNTNFFVVKLDNNGNFKLAFRDGFGFDQGNSIAVDGAGNILVGGTGNAFGGQQTAYFAKYNAAGERQFLHRIGGGSNEWVQRIATDANNNIYIAGNMKFAGDYDPGPNTFTLDAPPNQLFDVFMAKYDAGGNFIFAKKVGGDSRDEIFDMTRDAAGNMYITGVFTVLADFDPGPGVANITGGPSENIFFAKYNSNGEYMYAKSVGAGFTGDRGQGIAADADGNAYVTGFFGGTADFDPGPGVFTLNASAGPSFFARYDPAGNLLMAKNIAGISKDISTSGDKFWVTGEFSGNYDFDPSAASSMLTTTGGIKNAYHAGYSLEGNYFFAGQIGNHFGTATLNELVNQSVTDAAGNHYIIGNFVGSVDFDPGPGILLLENASTTASDIFFAKYNNAGELLFAKRIGGNTLDAGFSIAIDKDNQIIITGGFTGTVDFDPGPGTANLVNGSTAQQDFFLAKYDADGNYLWAKKSGNTSTPDQGRYVTVDATGNIYCTGLYTATVDFNFGDGVANLVSVNANVADMFVAKYNKDGEYQLAFSIAGQNTKFPNVLQVDTEGNMYLAGTFVAAIDVDPGPTSVLLSSGSTVGADVFFAKYSPTGSYLMAKKFGATTVGLSETVNAMSLALNGDILLTGGFAGTVDFDPGAGTASLSLASGTAMYVARYTTNGEYVFAKMIANTGTNTTGTTLGLDAGGNIFLAGIFNGPTDLDPGPGTVIAEPTAGGFNILMIKLDAAGNYLGSGSFGGSGPMQPVTRQIYPDAQGNFMLAGFFSRLGDFDPTSGIVERSASNGNDIFMAKFSSATAPSVYITTKAGAWNDPATWMGGQVPPSGAAVQLLHTVDISGNIVVKTMEVKPGGGVNMATGTILTILQ
jgi:hypothetical protein